MSARYKYVMDLSSSLRNIVHSNTHSPAIKELLLSEFGSEEAVDKVQTIVLNTLVEISAKLDRLQQLHVSSAFFSEVS